MRIWLVYNFYIWFLEAVFHLQAFGTDPVQPFFLIGTGCLCAALFTIVLQLVPNKIKKLFFWLPLLLLYVIFGVQTGYYHIFKQPLQWQALFVGGGDALTNYWKEALTGFFEILPLLFVMALPFVLFGVLLKKKKLVLPERNIIGFMRMLVMVTLGSMILFDTVEIGRIGEFEYYETYLDFYDPISVMESMGVGTMVLRDGTFEIETMLREKLQMDELSFAEDDENWFAEESGSDFDFGDLGEEDSVSASGLAIAVSPEPFGNADAVKPTEGNADPDAEGAEVPVSGQETQEQGPTDTSPQIFTIDFEKLRELSGKSKEKNWLCTYLQEVEPTCKNEYTGMFEGYNLIFLTAEGFSTYAISEDLTPTLYRLSHSGFVFPNYYVPLWQTSTSDGEYINCTGLIPDGQFSMKKSGDKDMAYALPRFFAEEGVKAYAFHNNSLTYYDRHISHPNLGYEFLAAKKGDISSSQAEGKIFPMEHPNYWPASDLEMMEGTIPYYRSLDRFLVYYMTVSGHMNYNFGGNRMSAKNKDLVRDLPLSENARAYKACQIELDRALEYLLKELENAGVLDRTVICLSADHYPYAMTAEQYEELAGRDLTVDKEVFRNTLILWNSQMEEPVVVEKACGSMDLIPTLLNLFGMPYDSRMYAGRDIFSTAEGMVIFNDRSFVTDTVIYNKKKKTYTWLKELSDEEKKIYINAMTEETKNRYQFSAYVLRNDYYHLIEECRVKE